ncbi:MAG: phosphoglycerate dehydrogenase [Verrucomicrobiota bacterium]
MLHVLVCDPISPRGIAYFQARPEFQVTQLPRRHSEAELLPLLAEVDALVVRSETKVTRAVLENAPRLQVVGRAGVGVDNVDVEAATQRGVVVMNTPAGNTITTAELTFFMLGALARKIPAAHGTMCAGRWDRKAFQGTELHGKTLGILGAGRIGTEVGKRALAFGMRVVAYDPFLSEARARQLGFDLALDPDGVYREADFLTVHLPVTPETRGMIHAEAIARMKPGVRLVNCARGEIVNEADLVAALRSGRVGGAALDVFAVEPLPADHPFRTLPNVVLTPHLGASSEEAQEKCGLEVAEIISAFLLTGEVRNAVNLPGVDARTYELVKPYLLLGNKLGRLLGQLTPPPFDRLHITFGGRAQELPQTDPVTRAILQGFLSQGGTQDINNINVRSVAAAQGITVEEKRSDEPVTFNEWLHVQVYHGEAKVISAGGTFFGSPNNPRIVRLYSLPVEIPISGHLLLVRNQDRPGIVGHLGTILGRHGVNIANMSLSRDGIGSEALTVLHLDSPPPAAALQELAGDPAITQVRLVTL